MSASIESETIEPIPVSKMLPGQFAVVTSNSTVRTIGNIVYRTGEACETQLIDLTYDDGWSGCLPKSMMVQLLSPGTLLKIDKY